jgi:hypothetical protein
MLPGYRRAAKWLSDVMIAITASQFELLKMLLLSIWT